MFEIGKSYSITTIHDGEYYHDIVVVLAWEAPLLKYASDDKENILNTSCPTFCSANRVASTEEVAAAEAAFLDRDFD